jgi:hypothetical protein
VNAGIISRTKGDLIGGGGLYGKMIVISVCLKEIGCERRFLSCRRLPTFNKIPEDGGDTFLRNVGKHLQDHTASQSKRRPSTYSLP